MQARERRLAGPGRPPEDERDRLAGPNDPLEDPARAPGDGAWPTNSSSVLRAEAVGERRAGAAPASGLAAEEVVRYRAYTISPADTVRTSCSLREGLRASSRVEHDEIRPLSRCERPGVPPPGTNAPRPRYSGRAHRPRDPLDPERVTARSRETEERVERHAIGTERDRDRATNDGPEAIQGRRALRAEALRVHAARPPPNEGMKFGCIERRSPRERTRSRSVAGEHLRVLDPVGQPRKELRRTPPRTSRGERRPPGPRSRGRRPGGRGTRRPGGSPRSLSIKEKESGPSLPVRLANSGRAPPDRPVEKGLRADHAEVAGSAGSRSRAASSGGATA